MTKDQIIAMARKAGFNASNGFSQLIVRHSNGSWMDVEKEITHLVAIAYTQGQRDMREAAAGVCEAAKPSWIGEKNACAAAIRALPIKEMK